MDEKRLLVSLRDGDGKAFDAIYRKYASILYYFSLDMLKDEVEAKEIVQDVFLVIWENRKIIDPERSFRNYLNTIARHKIYNVFRRRAAVRNYEQSGDKTYLERLEEEDHIQFDDLKKMIEKSISRLAPYQKEVLVLKMQKLTNDEIAEMLNISNKTVEYHLTKAYKQLRTDLHFLKNSLGIFMSFIYSTL